MRNSFVRKSSVICARLAVAAAILLSPQLRGQTASAPAQPGPTEIAGIRPGMTAQQAYDALKAHAHGAKIVTERLSINGVSETPIPVGMAVMIPDTLPAEIVTVWLTTPPSTQVVWAVGETMKYPDANQMLTESVLGALRKKFGAEQTANGGPTLYWTFDRQGSRRPEINAASCVTFNLNVTDPNAPTFSMARPPLYVPVPPKSPCDPLVSVTGLMEGPNNADRYVTRITLIVVDHALVRSNAEAYNVYLANAAAAKQKQDLDKAKEQKAPVF
ncbi:MAG TPA: hypothetical protein VF865_02665 [Acidobacteriaceae bacterium]